MKNDIHQVDALDKSEIQDQVIFASQNRVYPKYKHGGEKEFLRILYSSIKPIEKTSFENSTGIYRFRIDTFGNTFDFSTHRSISPEVDTTLFAVLDTMAFTPASINGVKETILYTLPIKTQWLDKY